MDTPKETSIKDNSARDMAVRTASLDYAIKSNCGQCYDTDGRIIHDAEEILKAAKMFEEYIKGNNEMKKDEWK